MLGNNSLTLHVTGQNGSNTPTLGSLRHLRTQNVTSHGGVEFCHYHFLSGYRASNPQKHVKRRCSLDSRCPSCFDQAAQSASDEATTHTETTPRMYRTPFEVRLWTLEGLATNWTGKPERQLGNVSAR